LSGASSKRSERRTDRKASTVAMAQANQSSDGRKARSERTRAAIVEAMMELIAQGNLQPTSEEVARQAKVGHRTVFRHFQDMDLLYREIATRLEARVFSGIAPVAPKGSLKDRVGQLVLARSKAFEKAKLFRRATIARRWSSSFLQQTTRRFARILHERLHFTLPELSGKPESIQSAVELMLSYDGWEELRIGQGLSIVKARGSQIDAVLAMIGDK